MVMGEGKNPGVEHLTTLGEEHNLKNAKLHTAKVQAAVARWKDYAAEAGVSAKSTKPIEEALNNDRNLTVKVNVVNRGIAPRKHHCIEIGEQSGNPHPSAMSLPAGSKMEGNGQHGRSGKFCVRGARSALRTAARAAFL